MNTAFSRYPGMSKVVFADEWDSLLQAAGGHLVRLVNTDTGIKQAASDLFSKSALEQYRPPRNKFMLHVIGVASEEDYGFNKNADAFSREDLRDYHHTFLDGHMFREHLNQDPQFAIGEIKAAGYHPTLHRVELVLWGDREKAAAEYEKAKRGDAISVSMACKVARDRCSIIDCKNLARSPKEYCWHLKTALGRYIPEKRAYAYAQNPRPKFFDMSSVENPAERTARYLQYAFSDDGELQKAASSRDAVPGGAKWAEIMGLESSDSRVVPLSASRLRALEKLAATEAWMRGLLESRETPSDSKAQFALAALNAWDPDATLSADQIKRASVCRPGTMFRELAKRAVFLPVQTLYGYLMDVDPEVLQKSADCSDVCSLLPSLFEDAFTEATATGGLDEVGHLCDADSQSIATFDSNYTDSVQKVMDDAITQFSAKTEPMTSRATHIIIIKQASGRLPKQPEKTAGLRAMGLLYAGYKAAAYEDTLMLNPDMDADKLAILAVAQNFRMAENA